MSTDETKILKRIDETLDAPRPTDTSANHYAWLVEKLQTTLTLATSLYGVGSLQAQTLVKAADKARSKEGKAAFTFHEVGPVVDGTLRAMRADIKAGLVGNIALRAAGELLSDLLGLAKEALTEGTEGAKSVAAVLSAAAYEDTVRKMGESLAGVTGRPDLSDVLGKLKTAGVLTGAPFTTAQGYLKFRNDALHADWKKINPAVVGSCIAFVEGLILEHFS